MSHFSGDHSRNSYNSPPPSSNSTPSNNQTPYTPGHTKSASTSQYPTNGATRYNYVDSRQPQPYHDSTANPTPPAAPSAAWQSRERSPQAIDSPPITASPVTTRGRSNSRPLSMVIPQLPPSMDINEDTPPELQPIFSFLNSHANKLYQEGYFLKLDDQNTRT